LEKERGEGRDRDGEGRDGEGKDRPAHFLVASAAYVLQYIGGAFRVTGPVKTLQNKC